MIGVVTVLFFAVFSVANVNAKSADTYAPGLRVRYGSGDTRGVTYYFDIPLNVTGVKKDGWVEIPASQNTPLKGLKLYCPSNDVTFCGFYDDSEYIAGVQVAIATAKLQSPVPSDLTKIGYIMWEAPATGGGVEKYWANQKFFVSQGTLDKTSKTDRAALRTASDTLLYDGAVWISDFNGKLMRLPNSETGLASTGYTRQGCYPGMGRHYYYKMSNQTLCTEVSPWFPLISSGGGRMVGNGFLLFGVVPAAREGTRTWFENQTEVGVRSVIPDAPQCLFDLAESNITTIHMYYVAEPWNIDCDEN